jgi:hypothetical protein
MQDAIEEANIPVESVLLPTKNPMQIAMEEVTDIPLESVLLFSGSGNGRPSSH